jgi:hypothetical protein
MLNMGNNGLVSTDSTYFLIPEHGQIFYSFKFKKLGLCSEIALYILIGDIIWIIKLNEGWNVE